MYPAELEIKTRQRATLLFLLGFTTADREGRSAAHFPLRQT